MPIAISVNNKKTMTISVNNIKKVAISVNILLMRRHNCHHTLASLEQWEALSVCEALTTLPTTEDLFCV